MFDDMLAGGIRPHLHVMTSIAFQKLIGLVSPALRNNHWLELYCLAKADVTAVDDEKGERRNNREARRRRPQAFLQSRRLEADGRRGDRTD
jgi:hypothetical protein